MTTMSHITYLCLILSLVLLCLGLDFQNDELRANNLLVPKVSVSELMGHATNK